MHIILKAKHLTLYSMILFFLVGCDKEEPTPNPTPTEPTPIFEKVWSTRIYEAPLENVGSDNAYIYKDLYLVTGDHWSHPDPSIFAYNCKTGLLEWKWTQTGRLQFPGYYVIGKENLLILYTSKGLICFDIDAKQMVWEIVFEDEGMVGGNGPVIFGDEVFYVAHLYSRGGPAIYFRANLKTGSHERIYQVDIDGGWTPSLSPAAFWINPISSDTLLLTINGKSMSGHGPETSPTDLLAINLRTKQLEWKMDSIMEVRTNLLTPPVIFENSVIFGGDWSIYSVDIPSSTVNWRTQFTDLMKVGNFNRTGLLLHDGRVYANPDVFGVMCLDAKNGDVIWHNKKIAATCSPNMLYNDDMLITSSWGQGSVFIIDAFTGEVIHKERSEHDYNIDVLYDSETDMYFVQDFAEAVGFKINKPK